MTAEAGRDLGAMLESRDLVILLDRRRSHVWGWTFGVLPCELSLPSGITDASSAMMTGAGACGVTYPQAAPMCLLAVVG